MLAAPPADGVWVEEEGGRERRVLSLPATEVDEPPPFHVDSKGEEPWLCGRRLSLTPAEVREARKEVGSDRRPGEGGGADFKDKGGRSEP